jgi:sRNA-binding carbon storage regulator CsrA
MILSRKGNNFLAIEQRISGKILLAKEEKNSTGVSRKETTLVTI